MTIEEAVTHHKNLSQVKSELALKTTNEALRNHAIESDKKRSEEHWQYVAWLTELKQLREENSELKRLLRLAVEDMKNTSFCAICINCDSGICSKVCDFTAEEFKWKHADEAENLIGGGDENA